jgi:hypothetical protein
MNRYPRQPRQAVVLVVALVCLLVALSIATTMVTETISRRVQLPVELQARQAALLVQAGRGRAAVRLADDADYHGESWTPKLNGDESKTLVEIRVESLDDNRARVQVTVNYPDSGPQSIRRSLVFSPTYTNLSPEE